MMSGAQPAEAEMASAGRAVLPGRMAGYDDDGCGACSSWGRGCCAGVAGPAHARTTIHQVHQMPCAKVRRNNPGHAALLAALLA